jgi:Pectate lyase superfamily protein
MFKYFFLICLFFSQVTTAQPFFNVKKMGLKGDGKTNDYKALKKIIDSVNNLKSGTIYFPRGTYKIDEYVRENEKGQSLNGIKNFAFKDINGLKIFGEKGTVISIKGNFYKKIDFTGYKNYSYSFDSQISFVFNGCDNVEIYDLEINGNNKLMTRHKDVVENGSHGMQFGSGTSDSNSNVKISNVYIHHFSADGIVWKSKGGNVKCTNTVLKNNGRCALAIVQGQNMWFNNCQFSETGFNIGTYESHGPNTGVDIENESYSTIKNINFLKCSFKKNLNTQFACSGFDGVGAGRTTGVTIDSCVFEEDIKHFYLPDRTVYITSDNSIIKNSTIIGTINFDLNRCIQGGQPENGVEINNCVIKTTGNGIRINCEFKLKIKNCIIEQLPNLSFVQKKVPFPFIIGASNTILEKNIFIYHTSNWFANSANPNLDYDNYMIACKDILNNTFKLVQDRNDKLIKGKSFLITIDKKFIEKNKLEPNAHIGWNVN